MNPDFLNKLLRWGLLLLAGSLIFSLAISQAIVVLMVLVWLIKVILLKEHNIKSNPLIYPFLAFILARIISIFFSVDFNESLQILNREVFFYFLFFIFIDVFPVIDREFVKRFFYILIIAAVLAAVYGSVKVVFGFEERATSTTSGYSTLGMFLTVVIAVVMAFGKNKFLFPSRIIWFITVFIILAGILFTFNRTHWGITGLIFLVVGIVRERKFVSILSVIALILIFTVPALNDRFYQLLNFTGNLSDRDVIWQGAFMIFFENPLFGFGPRTFREVFPLFNQLGDQGISSWHCDYLQVYMDSGILGLASFLWLMISIYFFLFRFLKKQILPGFYKDIIFALLLAISAFYLTAIVGGFIFDPISSLLFQMLIGSLALIISNKNELKVESRNI